jgi:molybdenum cofactor cytidylyltransferase
VIDRVPGRHADPDPHPVAIGGVVLAAGGGSRFGDDPKLLADLHGQPVLERVVWNACAVPALERIVVVLGAHADRISAEVDLLDAEIAVCEDWAAGQAASLGCGLDALGDTSKVLVLLGDQPLVTPQVIAWLVGERVGSRATYGGDPGHPVVLGPKLIRRARALDGDRGLREDVRWHPVEVGHLASNRDLDTNHDLEAIRREARAVLRS